MEVTTNEQEPAPDDISQVVMASHEMGWALEQILEKFDEDPEGAKESLGHIIAAHSEFHGALQKIASR